MAVPGRSEAVDDHGVQVRLDGPDALDRGRGNFLRTQVAAADRVGHPDGVELAEGVVGEGMDPRRRVGRGHPATLNDQDPARSVGAGTVMAARSCSSLGGVPTSDSAAGRRPGSTSGR